MSIRLTLMSSLGMLTFRDYIPQLDYPGNSDKSQIITSDDGKVLLMPRGVIRNHENEFSKNQASQYYFSKFLGKLDPEKCPHRLYLGSLSQVKLNCMKIDPWCESTIAS
jgi:hypothetical protein